MLRNAPRGSGAVLGLRVFLFGLGVALFAYVTLQSTKPIERYHVAKANHEGGHPFSPDHTGAEVTILTTNKNVELYTRCWSPHGETKVLFMMVHGYTFHSQYFSGLAHFLLPYGVKACTLDLTGHGRSGALMEQRGYVESMQDWVNDVDLLAHYLHFSHPGLPIFAYGESMGGNLLLRLMCHSRSIQNVIQGYVLANPPVRVSESVLPPKWLLPVLRVVGRVLPMLPALGANVGGEEWKAAFGDQEFAEVAYADPLMVLSTPKLGPMTSVLAMTSDTYARLEECSAPFLALSGGDDRRAESQYILELLDRASSRDKSIKVYAGMRHQLLQETADNKQVVMNDIRDWMLHRLPAAIHTAQQPGAKPLAVDGKGMVGGGAEARGGVSSPHTEL